MAKKVFGGFLIFLFTTLIVLYFKTGAYKSVTVEKSALPELQVFYVENIGPYHKIIDKIKFVEDQFKELGIPCKKTFGQFYSDPEIIDHKDLISHVGCAFYPAESPQVFTLPEGVNEKFIGTGNENCYKGSFTGSPSLSAMKIYPKIKDMAENDSVKLSIKALEIYHVDGDSVTTEVYLCEKRQVK